jgi:hypothetical protein
MGGGGIQLIGGGSSPSSWSAAIALHCVEGIFQLKLKIFIL